MRSAMERSEPEADGGSENIGLHGQVVGRGSDFRRGCALTIACPPLCVEPKDCKASAELAGRWQ